jgi:hypothetical protein
MSETGTLSVVTDRLSPGLYRSREKWIKSAKISFRGVDE